MESSMTHQSKIITYLLTAVLCLSATNLFAETKSFQEYLNIAKEAYDKKDYEEAIRNLLLANSVENNARLLFNIAKSYQKLDACDKAIVYFMAFRRQSTAGAELRAQALTEIKNSRTCQTVKPLAGRFFIKSEPSGAMVKLDGVDLGITPLEVAGYKAGTHDIVFSLNGYQETARSFETLAGNDQLISQQLDAVNSEGEEITLYPDESDSNLVPIIIGGSVTTIGLGVLGYAIYTDTVTIVDLKKERNVLTDLINDERSADAAAKKSKKLTDRKSVV